MIKIPVKFLSELKDFLSKLVIQIGPHSSKEVDESRWSIPDCPEYAFDKTLFRRIYGLSGNIHLDQKLGSHINHSVLTSILFDKVQEVLREIIKNRDTRVSTQKWQDLTLQVTEVNDICADVSKIISAVKEWNIYVPLHDVDIESDFDFGHVRFIKCDKDLSSKLQGESSFGLFGSLRSINLDNRTLLLVKSTGIHYKYSRSLVLCNAEKVVIPSLSLICICFLLSDVPFTEKYMGGAIYPPALNMLIQSHGDIADNINLERLSPFTKNYLVNNKFINEQSTTFQLFDKFIKNVPEDCYLKGIIHDSLEWFYDYLWESNAPMRFIKLLIACEILLEVQVGAGQSMKFTDNASILAGRDLKGRIEIATKVDKILKTRGSIFHKGKRNLDDISNNLFDLLKIYLHVLLEVTKIAIDKPESRDQKGYRNLLLSQKYGALHPNVRLTLPTTLFDKI